MLELGTDFRSLPEDYQSIIQLAQDTYKIKVAPLELLVGGWSGAAVYLVSVARDETRRIEHCILKLDHKSRNARSDEVTRHNTVMEKAAPEFAQAHIAELAFDRIERDGAIAIFYRIAGESLQQYRPLSNYERQSQLKTLFAETNRVLLSEWNQNATFEQAIHPQKLLEKWLGFRLEEGGSIERFVQESVDADVAGLLVNGHVFPNPLLYARKAEPWGHLRALDVATGFIHGDLNTNNILVRFANDQETLDGYYLIDFALFKEDMPLLYDQRYLEMSYLMLAMSQVSFAKSVNFLTLLAVADLPDPYRVPIEMSGVCAVIAAARSAFGAWVQASHPSLHDDLWGQYWLAGVAAGLAYCHKAGQPEEQRLAGLIFAAANLKRFAAVFKLPQPTDVELLYDEGQPDSLSTRKAKHNLPVQPMPFIGRAAQVSELKELILKPDMRLVTLLGPGGAGKTRLSLQVAQEVLDHFPNGVFFVPLADDTTLDQLISRVDQQLDLREGGRPLLDSVKDYLRNKQMLLLLDNFEQLTSAAPVVAEVLAAAPQVKVIATSRIALKLQGERVYPIPPLKTPRRDLTIDELMECESVHLFVERSRAVQPSFSLTQDNAAAVTEICRRLDGLPLALELAAARVRLLSPQAILARLDDQFKLLTGGARDLPSRHQTLHNTLEWSYSLLEEDKKRLYMYLGIFVGGFTFEAAEAVCNTENEFDILDGLTALVDNSLLRQESMPDGESRFSILETIRAYALERLTESGEKETLQARHAQYFGNIVLAQAGEGLYSVNALYWLNWIEREMDNLRATLNWSLSAPERIPFGTAVLWWLIWFYYRRGYLTEGRMWARRFLDSSFLEPVSGPRAMALLASGTMTLWQGEQGPGLAQLEEGMTIEQRLEDEMMMAPALLGKGVALINMGQDSAARPVLEEAEALFKEFYQPYYHVFTTVHLGNVELGLGNLEKALAWEEAAYAEAQAINENWLLSFVLNNMGEVARTQGKYELARKYYEECEVLLQNTGDAGDMARFVHSLGYIAQHEGDLVRAGSQFRKSLKMFRKLGNRRGMAECMAGLAGLKARQGDAQRGAVMLNAAEAILEKTRGAWWPADRLEVDANRALIRSALSEAEWTAALHKGQAMSLDQALAFATES